MPWLQNSCGRTRVMSVPSNRSSPLRQRSRPAMALISVVLPAPLGPITATISPAATSSEASHTAVASPYPTWRLRASSSIGLPEIDADHARIAHDLARRAERKELALVQDRDPVGELDDRAHQMLDEDDGGAL